MKYKIIFLIFSCLFCISIIFAQKKHTHNGYKDGKIASPARKIIIKYGIASYYANKFVGRKTASGEIYRKEKLTAACNSLPLRTWIKVTNLKNNRSVIVKINDRLHRKNKRLIDLSYHAASVLGYTGRGLTRVKIEVLNNFKIGN
ncbi:MAG: septal ring lytic transglycosylase RlpA family protein [Ginsengibacter sp.]